MRHVARVGTDAGPRAIQRVRAGVLQVGEQLPVIGVGVEVRVAVRPVGPQEGVPDGALVVGLAIRRIERAGMVGCRGGRQGGVVGKGRHGCFEFPGRQVT